jgi:DNA-binding NarL/FixJ family response regulator
VPIDVLAELLDHRSYSMTRRYYRIGEDRRRAAVDTVTALSFDRHGNRIWRDAQMLLESERARHAVGEVAVPYGTCTEPTNVKAGREREIATDVAEGLANKHIARRRGISVNTVENHLRSIFGKTGVDSRTQLALAASTDGSPPIHL